MLLIECGCYGISCVQCTTVRVHEEWLRIFQCTTILREPGIQSFGLFAKADSSDFDDDDDDDDNESKGRIQKKKLTTRVNMEKYK